ncbi:MAG: hypothetical protein JJU06_01445 [Ectothiorhodospiraceae bacterium]|nr:hypothetical protein [Ectothiorhodospiraceae bacterium]
MNTLRKKPRIVPGLTLLLFAIALSACGTTYSQAQNAEVLVDNAGRTVYIFDNDTANSGESACYDGCARAWPPVPADSMPGAGTLTRTDGFRQAVHDGLPLYYFAGDQTPGDRTGDGLNDVWHVVPQAAPTSRRSTRGYGGY